MKKHNILLRQALTTALIITGLGTQIEAYAIALGEINVKSYLGQPLRATIKVQRLAGLKYVDCFRLGEDVGNINAINQADLKLGKVQNDSAILTITTNYVILEPIISLTLITECAGTLSRNYMLLIDPMLVSEVDSLGLSADLNQVKPSQNNDENDYNVDNSDYLQPITSAVNSAQFKQVQAPAFNEKSSIKAKRPKKIYNKDLVSNQNLSKRVKNAGNRSSSVTEASRNSGTSLALQQTAQPTTELTKAPLIKPPSEQRNPARLSISGLETLKINANSVSTPENSTNPALSRPILSLDKSLHYLSETAPQVLATENEFLDEATVLNNRLAHLEKQISALQLRNQMLESSKDLQVNYTTQAIDLYKRLVNGIFSWWPLVLGASVVVSAYFATAWWRRRPIKQLDDAQSVLEALRSSSSSAPVFKPAEIEQDLFDLDNSQAVVEVNKNFNKHLDTFEAAPFAATLIEVEDHSNLNILDHVDVFLSHGRVQLAIQLLQNHLLEFPKQSITIWLFFLELLAEQNLPEIYNQTALECKEHFNISVAEFTNDEASEKQSFEDFVRLIAGLEQIWGTTAAIDFCDDLIYNYRLESRVGFDKNVLEEIILLRNIAQETLKSAEVIQLNEKKNKIKERKEAQIAANKQTKLLKMEELHLTLASVEQVQNDTLVPEDLFEFNFIENK